MNALLSDDAEGERLEGMTPTPADPTSTADLDSAIAAALAAWRPYEPPPAPFPRAWRDDVPSWLERVCDPDDAPTGAWTWQRLALLARHAEGRVALEARAAFQAALAADEKLRDHLEFHALCCDHHFDDDLVDGARLDMIALVRRETAEALVEQLEPGGKGPLRDTLYALDRRVCAGARIEPSVRPERETTRNAVWRDDHKRLLANVAWSTPLDWWGEIGGHGFRPDVLAARARGEEEEARVRGAYARREIEA